MRGNMKGRKVKIWAAGVVGILAGGVGLVGTPVHAATKTTITYYTFSAAPDHTKALNAMVAAFEKKNPTIHVVVQNGAYGDYFTKLKTRIVGNLAPDTFELNFENFVPYALSGTLLDLNSQSKKDKTFKKSAYYGKAYNVFAMKGKQYGLPASFSTVVLFYNKDLFKSAGVALPNSSWDWSDEIAASAALKAKLPEGSYADFQPVQFFEFYKTLAAAGGKFFNADKTKVLFNKAPGIAALNNLINRVKDGYMPNKAQLGTVGEIGLFTTGKLAMIHTGIWNFDGFKDLPFGWDIAVEPGSVSPSNHFFSNAVVASAKTKHPEAAWKWARFMTSDPAAVKIRIAASWEIPAVSDKKALAGYLNNPLPANRPAVFEALKYPTVPPVIRQQQQMQDAVSAWLEKALNGSVSVTEALNSAASDVNALLEKE
ncbi:MAG: sugar ABC transporter substrate-binding protein [Actinomycetota bacterium]